MGQQQLLLIVLGAIVIVIAIVIGITLFSSDAVSSNRDAVISDLNNLGAKAIQYYKKPTSMGGGGNTFTGWTIPLELDTTANGNYTRTVAAQSVRIRGYGTENALSGNTFTGWALPLELDSTANGNYTRTVTAQSVKIRGYGTEKAPNGNKIRHTATVTPTGITVVKNN